MRRLPPNRSACAAALIGVAAATACESTVDPGSLKFGTVGEASIELVTPAPTGDGMLVERLVWSSTGPWHLNERITYQGQTGDENSRASVLDPEGLAGWYSRWIAQFNSPGISPLEPIELEPLRDLPCPTTRLTLTVSDEIRGVTKDWTRCVNGPLSRFDEFEARGDLHAARVAAAARFMRDNALADGRFVSSFDPSLPFATVLRGDDTPLPQRISRTILTEEAWRQFWAQHAGGSASPPPVDFGKNLVLVAIHPEIRREAGDSIEIRRILPHGEGTTVEMTLRRPGAFCSPAQLNHVPFHIVVAPRAHVMLPVAFQTPIKEEHVPCGT